MTHGLAMLRRVQRELLDDLPPEHPDALHNRRDLRFFNAVMGNYRWFERVLRAQLRPGDRVLEIGAGAGDLGRRLHQSWNGTSPAYTGLDLWPRPADWPEPWSWARADLSTFGDYGRHDVVIGNLILHQFEDDVLAELGRKWREQARLLVFCEPARHPLHLVQLPLANLAGINYVSRHDARVSIEAGFRGGELPRLLSVNQPPWRVELTHSFLGAYRMVAVRGKTDQSCVQ